MTDAATIRGERAGGPFHELRHNHQWSDWVLPGTTEATVHLFSVYWARRLGAQADRDLGPFFPAWGLPRSASVLDELAARPAWTDDPMNP